MESFRELSLDRSNWVINQGSPERGSEFFQVTPNGPYVLRRISDSLMAVGVRSYQLCTRWDFSPTLPGSFAPGSSGCLGLGAVLSTDFSKRSAGPRRDSDLDF